MQHQQHAQKSLSQPNYLILASLLQGPKDAIELGEAIEQVEGLFFEPGTLYRLLAHLEQRGWIEALTTEHPLRRYHITALGLVAFDQADASRQREHFREEGRPDMHKGKAIITPLVFWALHLYPPAWRERYEADMVALLKQHEITLWTVVDLLIAALATRLDPHYQRTRPMVHLPRLRTSWWLMRSAWLAF